MYFFDVLYKNSFIRFKFYPLKANISLPLLGISINESKNFLGLPIYSIIPTN